MAKLNECMLIAREIGLGGIGIGMAVKSRQTKQNAKSENNCVPVVCTHWLNDVERGKHRRRDSPTAYHTLKPS
jgi:hypothetical protein